MIKKKMAVTGCLLTIADPLLPRFHKKRVIPMRSEGSPLLFQFSLYSNYQHFKIFRSQFIFS